MHSNDNPNCILEERAAKRYSERRLDVDDRGGSWQRQSSRADVEGAAAISRDHSCRTGADEIRRFYVSQLMGLADDTLANRRRTVNDRGAHGGSAMRRPNGQGAGHGAARSDGDDPNKSVMVRNLSSGTSAEEVRRALDGFGEVRDVHLVKDFHTGEPRGFGFVEFTTARDAQHAAAEAERTRLQLDGRALTVSVTSQRRKCPAEMVAQQEHSRGGGERDVARRLGRDPRLAHDRRPLFLPGNWRCAPCKLDNFECHTHCIACGNERLDDGLLGGDGDDAGDRPPLAGGGAGASPDADRRVSPPSSSNAWGAAARGGASRGGGGTLAPAWRPRPAVAFVFHCSPETEAECLSRMLLGMPNNLGVGRTRMIGSTLSRIERAAAAPFCARATRPIQDGAFSVFFTSPR